MNKRTNKVLAGAILATGIALAACAAPTPQVVEKQVEVTREVEKQVVVTQEVVKEVPAAAGERIPVRWYVGLGTGSNKDQIPIQKDWVDAYNKSQDKYQLIIEIVANAQAADNLKAQIAAGNSPDIIGPVGKYGRAAFINNLLDIEPLIEAANVDLSKYDPKLLEFVKDDDRQVGLPYALFPAVVYFNKDIFDEAGLAYPPQKFGEKYKFPDGTEKEWNVDTMIELSQLLTVDKNGKDATQADFDPKNIRTWGMNQQWGNFTNVATMCGAGTVWDAANKKAVVPENWRDCVKKIYDAMWTKHSYPNAEAAGSELLSQPNEFASGNVGMAYTHTWYMCCMSGGNLKRWGVGVAPTYNGQITSKMHGDTFSILKDTKNPEAAFEVMQAMLASKELEKLYNGLPSGDAEREAYFKAKEEQFGFKPGDVNWQVFLDSIPYPDVPSHEAFVPNFLKSQARMNEFQTLLASKGDLDVDAELDKLQADLQKLFEESDFQ
jgi:multiple sugar transport system substrate-binding protein